MTEHDPMDGFETRLTALVRSYTEPAANSDDPLATARTAMAAATAGGVVGRLRPVGIDRRAVWLLVLGTLVLAAAAIAIAGGSRPSLVVEDPDGPGRIVFVRDGDLFVAETDGSGQTLMASGRADDGRFGYLTAAWSPDMAHIAAVRDVGGPFLMPAVDLLTADGALVRTVALDAGCGPSLTLSPDSSEVAIAACPADVRRDTIEPVDAGIRLLVAGLDASRDREIALPPEWRTTASANPEVWIRPDLWARWSPDGRWIALPVILGGQPGWHLVDWDGSGTRRIEKLTPDLYTVDQFDWSPDGRRLATSGSLVDCAEGVCLGIVDLSAEPVTATVRHPSAGLPDLHGKLFWPEFSPGGDEVAVISGLIDFAEEPEVADTSTLSVYDPATARFTELTSGTRTLTLGASGAAEPTGEETGELVAGGTVAWTPDGQRLLYLVREDNDAGAGWTIRSIDAVGGSPSSELVRDVQSFDLGFRH